MHIEYFNPDVTSLEKVHQDFLYFVEVTGRMGGDVITYRIYDDGSVYER